MPAKGWLGTALIVALIAPVVAIETSGVRTDHDNVIVILDTSGSMGERMHSQPVQKMKAAQEALKQVVRQVPASTQLGVLVFANQGPDGNWLYPLGPLDQQRLERAIDSVRANGGTPLGEFIKRGADRLLEERRKQFGYGTFRLLIVTDGQATDQGLMEQYTPEVVARGITVDVIGVDMQETHTLATRVHSYRRADDPQALQQALAEVFAEVSADQQADPQMDFELLEGIPVEIADAMIQGLASVDNDPVGVGARPRVPSVVAQRAAPPRTAPAPPPVAPRPSPTPPPPRNHIPTTLLLVIIAVAVIAMRKAVRR